LEGKKMSQTADRKFDWVAGLATASGAVVMVASLVALAITVIAVMVVVF
jgi:hypothetical protein